VCASYRDSLWLHGHLPLSCLEPCVCCGLPARPVLMPWAFDRFTSTQVAPSRVLRSSADVLAYEDALPLAMPALATQSASGAAASGAAGRLAPVGTAWLSLWRLLRRKQPVHSPFATA